MVCVLSQPRQLIRGKGLRSALWIVSGPALQLDGILLEQFSFHRKCEYLSLLEGVSVRNLRPRQDRATKQL